MKKAFLGNNVAGFGRLRLSGIPEGFPCLSLASIVVLSLLLLGCSADDSALIISETGSEPVVLFCPRDGCSGNLTAYIINSSRSVHCSFFDLDLPQVMQSLSEKSAGIDVRVTIDASTDPTVSGRGFVPAKLKHLSHNKFCVFDGSIVWTGSMNPTDNDANKNNNNVLVVDSPALAASYEAEFSELWMGNFGRGRETIEPQVYLNGNLYESYFCPDDNCQGKVLAALQGARHSIHFMTFSFTDHDLARELIAADARGLDVQGVGESRRFDMQFEQYPRLLKAGIMVKPDSNPYILHHKVFIIDNSTVVLGSYNPTEAGTLHNDENVMIVHDPLIAEAYAQEFGRLYTSASNVTIS